MTSASAKSISVGVIRLVLLVLAGIVLFRAVTGSLGVVERAALLAIAGVLVWGAYWLRRWTASQSLTS
jgi:hypothetical protein